MEAVKERAIQLLSLVALVAAWQALAMILDTPALPPPAEVAVRFWEFVADASAFAPLASTLQSTIFGFLLAFTTGIVYGTAVYIYPRLGEVFSILFAATMFAPTLILIFIGLIMLGHDNRWAVVLITGIAVFPTITVYIRDALRDLDPEIHDMANSFKVKIGQRFRDVYLPYLVPPMLASGRIGFSMAWKVAFLTEVFGFPEGLGWRVRSAYSVYNVTSLLAWLTVFIIAILLIEQLTRMFERAIVKW